MAYTEKPLDYTAALSWVHLRMERRVMAWLWEYHHSC